MRTEPISVYRHITDPRVLLLSLGANSDRIVILINESLTLMAEMVDDLDKAMCPNPQHDAKLMPKDFAIITSFNTVIGYRYPVRGFDIDDPTYLGCWGDRLWFGHR